MKHRLILQCLLALSALVLAAGSSAVHSQALASGMAGLDITYFLQQDQGSLSFTLQAPAYKLEASPDQPGSVGIQVLDESQRYTYSRLEGAPELPHRQFNLALPPDADLTSLKFVVGTPKMETLSGQYILPAAPAWVDACGPDPTHGSICSENSEAAIPAAPTFALPAKPVLPAATWLEDIPVLVQLPPAEMRQWRFARLDFTPFHYDPTNGQLQVVQSLNVEIQFKRSPASLNPMLLSQVELGERLAQAVVDNYIDAREWYRIAAQDNPAPQLVIDYFIIGSQEAIDQPAVGEFELFLQEHGHKVVAIAIDAVDSMPGADRAEKTRAFLYYYYENMGLVYVLFIGDQSPQLDPNVSPGSRTGDVPMKTLYMDYFHSNTQWPGASDTFYVNLTSNWDKNGDTIYGEYPYTDTYGTYYEGDIGAGGMEFVPQIFVGRIPAIPGHYDQINPIIRKIMAYENITVRQSWQDQALLAMAFFDQNWDGGLLGHVLDQNLLAPVGYTSYQMYLDRYDYWHGVCEQDTYYPHDESLENLSVVNYWAQNPVGLMVWAGHGSMFGTGLGWSTPSHDCSLYGNLFTSGQAGMLKDSSPAFTFSNSCLNGHEGNQIPPYYEVTDNVQYALLHNGAVASVSANRVVKLIQNTEDGLPTSYASGEGMAYNYVEYLLKGYPAGEALGLSRAYYYPNSPAELLNYEDFNLYGDPAVVMYIPPVETLQAPTNLSAETYPVEGVPAFYLHWIGHNDWETQYYRISMSSSGGETITNASHNAVSALLTGAICNTNYTFKVKAVNGTTESPWSDPLTIQSVACPPATPPEGVWATPYANMVFLEWTEVPDNSYHIYRFGFYQGHIIYSGSTLIATIPAGQTSYTDVDVICGGAHYFYFVASFNPGGDSIPSPSNSVYTLACPPSAPVITDVIPTQTSLTVQWIDTNEAETSFIVAARKSGESWQWLDILPPNSTSFIFDNLTCSGPVYEFQVIVINDGGWTVSNIYPMHTSVCTITDPPKDLIPSPDFKSTTKISLNWSDDNDNEWGYKVEIYQDPDWVLKGTTDPNATSFLVSGLGRQSYDFQVIAYNAAGDSTPQPVSAATVPLSLYNPTDPHFTDTGVENLDLAWTAPATSNLAGYHLLRTEDPNHDPWQPLATVDAPDTTYSDTSVHCNTTYYYSLNAFGNIPAWASPFTNPISATTLICPPTEPTGLHAVGASHYSLVLTWQPTMDPPDLYSLEYYDTYMASWTPVITPTGVSTSTVFEQLNCGTSYDLRMRAKNSSGFSDYSDVLTAETTPCAPKGPSDLNVTAFGQTSISLAWTDHDDDEGGFQVERSVPGSVDWTGVFSTTANITSGNDTSAACGMNYLYRVFAYNDGGLSHDQANASASTLPCTPLLEAEPGVQGLVTLRWSDSGKTSTSYILQRSEDNSIWEMLGEAGGKQYSLRDLNAPCGTRLYDRIHSVSPAGNSPYSSPVTADTVCAPTGTITAQTVALTHNSIRIDWTALSGVDGYRVERSLTELGDWQLVGLVSSEVLTFTDTRLDTGTVYMYRVVGYNIGGEITSNPSSSRTLDVIFAPLVMK